MQIFIFHIRDVVSDFMLSLPTVASCIAVAVDLFIYNVPF